jgi:hypothetical protein
LPVLVHQHRSPANIIHNTGDREIGENAMNVAYRYSAGQRLAWLADRLIRFERPYLITGSQAAYQYHHWLTPLENMAHIQVYAADVPMWWRLAGDGCAVFETLPTTAQVRAAQKTIILEPTLESGRYRRRQMLDGLAFVAPEDLCLDLVERARGETSPAEVAAILIARREALDWSALLTQAGQRGLARHLGVLIEATGVELGAELAPAWFVGQLHRLAAGEPFSDQDYPSMRRRASLEAYPALDERWGVRLCLPHHVIGKVVLDLAAHSGPILQPAGR